MSLDYKQLPGWVASESLALCYTFQRIGTIASLQCLFWLCPTGPRGLASLSLWLGHFGFPKDFALLDAAVMVPGTQGVPGPGWDGVEGRAKLKPAAGILVMGVMEQNVMEIPSYLFNGKLEDSAYMVGFWCKQGRQLRTTAV